MQIKIENPILPIPNEELLLEEEKMWRVKLPFDYRDFLLNSPKFEFSKLTAI